MGNSGKRSFLRLCLHTLLFPTNVPTFPAHFQFNVQVLVGIFPFAALTSTSSYVLALKHEQFFVLLCVPDLAVFCIL